MKYLNRQPKPGHHKFQPYTVEQIDKHVDSERIWSTIQAIKLEAQEAVREAYHKGYADGKFDREVDKST